VHSRLEITFAYPNFKAKRWLFWKEKGFWQEAGALHERLLPQKSPSEKLGLHLL